VNDIMTADGSYNFTDGCGEISPDFMSSVVQKLGIKSSNVSAIQARFPCCATASETEKKILILLHCRLPRSDGVVLRVC